jgi:hypothetical protein
MHLSFPARATPRCARPIRSEHRSSGRDRCLPSAADQLLFTSGLPTDSVEDPRTQGGENSSCYRSLNQDRATCRAACAKAPTIPYEDSPIMKQCLARCRSGLDPMLRRCAGRKIGEINRCLIDIATTIARCEKDCKTIMPSQPDGELGCR